MKFRYCLLGSVPALAGILLMIFIAVDTLIIDSSFLDKTNQKYHVAQDLQMSETDLEKATEAMVDYVEGKISEAQVSVEVAGEKTEFFTEKELVHLVDVRELIHSFKNFRNLCIVLFILGILFFVWKKKIGEFCIGVWIAWGILFIVAIVVAAFAAVDIDLVINGFHEIFFSNDLWVLNFSLHRSLWLFQDQMYVDVLRYIAGIMGTIFTLTVVGTIIGYTKEMKRRRN